MAGLGDFVALLLDPADVAWAADVALIARGFRRAALESVPGTPAQRAHKVQVCGACVPEVRVTLIADRGREGMYLFTDAARVRAATAEALAAGYAADAAPDPKKLGEYLGYAHPGSGSARDYSIGRVTFDVTLVPTRAVTGEERPESAVREGLLQASVFGPQGLKNRALDLSWAQHKQREIEAALDSFVKERGYSACCTAGVRLDSGPVVQWKRRERMR